MDYIKSDFGRHKPIAIGSYFFFVIGVCALFFKEFSVGPLLVVVSLFLAFTTSGIELDLGKNKYLRYVKYFGLFKSGKWRNLNSYHYISVINSKKNPGVSGGVAGKKYNVVLLNNTHRKKLIVNSYETVKEALDAANKLSNDINFDVVKYHPAISSKTQRLRRAHH